MHSSDSSHPSLDPRGLLRRMVDHAAHLLPAQGPIGVFIHHNTLHAFQHLPFEQAVVEASRLYGTEPYMSEAAYRKEFDAGRIMAEDIHDVVIREPDADVIPGRLQRHALREALLNPGARPVDPRTLAWHLQEGDWLRRFRSDLRPDAAMALSGDAPEALWAACAARVPSVREASTVRPRRPAEAVQRSHGLWLDDVVHPPVIRLTGAFLDQGIAYWPMPLRELGLLGAARKIMGQPTAVFPRHLSGVGALLRDHEARSLDAEATVLEMLDALGVAAGDAEPLITAELLALPGWAGMVHRLEDDPTLAPHGRVPCSLMEFLALRLCYTVTALRSVCGDSRGWQQVAIPADDGPRVEVAALFDAAQLCGLTSREMAALPEASFAAFRDEVASCDALERRRLLHLAYERRHERRILVPLARHLSQPAPPSGPGRLAAQVIFCIDEREESIRRALEETDPEIETFGAAGFFGCAIDYAGIDDARSAALCPVVVKPAHEVREVALDDHSEVHARRRNLRRAWAAVARNSYVSSRTLLRGWFSTACLGFLSVFPLTFRVLRPLGYARLMKRLNALFLPEPRTELAFMRDDAAGEEATAGLMAGFSTVEKADRVASVLGPAGLHQGHARFVAVLGHGSTSLNNPFASAYDCGACGGRRGGPNARLFAAMANRPAVRAALRERGIAIPDDTWFVGGNHDTCSDAVEWFDLSAMPTGHRPDFQRLCHSLDRARTLSAHERTRRFEAANPNAEPEEALHHVEERSEHLGEPRPEYGHCTNAVCLVGRREKTRGLFFDRRAFLVSYDPERDPRDEALARVLGAVIPVCGGISLEYYFSTVDNEGYGCGTKLPHNITGLVGS